MVVNRALGATGCAVCRISALRAFTPVAATPFLARSSTGIIPNRTQWRQQVRWTTGPGRGHSTDYEEGIHTATVVKEEARTEIVSSASIGSETLPWYLQVDAPEPSKRPLSERQRIPDLPENPPPILQPLLEQISVDLGLDDLSLLDLRKLDPPPALGANLLMIIGTTRSEKHLHVSADRLCRWLRSKYHLRPDADGLLGRNELKLRMKRKAKRARLMGSASDDAYDDGVRTGWVCVDVGVVEGGSDLVSAPERPDFVGFGRQTDGVRIVVQMMTEEKRTEVDLEKLWSGILKRGGVLDVEENSELGTEEPDAPGKVQSELPPNYRPLGTTSSTNFSKQGQVRGFHTSARSLVHHRQIAQDVEANSDALYRLEPSILESISSGDIERAEAMFSTALSSSVEQNDQLRTHYLNSLTEYLKSLPVKRALEALGTGANDQESTTFLRAFYRALGFCLNQEQAELKIWLFCWAHDHQHVGYDSSALFRLSEDLQEAGVRISSAAYLDLIESILQSESGKGRDVFGIPKNNLRFASRIIETMYDQGLQVFSQEVLTRLLKATATKSSKEDVPAYLIYTDAVETFNLPSQQMSPIQKRLHLLVKHLDIPLFDEGSRLDLMELYSHQNNWLEFWDIWRLAARQGQPKSPELYASMFVLVATTHHIKGVQTVLREWVPEMAREEPPVSLQGKVALAVKYCLEVADPHVERDYEEDPNSPAEWVKLWRKCEAQDLL